MQPPPLDTENASAALEAHFLGRVDFEQCLALQQRLVDRATLCHDGQITLLGSTGPALGVVEDLDHHAETVPIHDGDSILLYTDGVTETTSSSGKQYGETQLRDMLIRNRHRCPADILDFIKCDVDRFAGPEPPEDDRTIMIIRVNRLMENESRAA